MKIILTGSIGHIGKPLTQRLVKNGHTVTVISSNPDRQKAIEALGANAAIGSMFDREFLTHTFKGADLVYLMETLEAAGDFFDKEVDFIASIDEIGNNYRAAAQAAGIKKVIHLSSIGAHLEKGNGILRFHYNVEGILKQLPEEVSIKFMRPVGFFTNLFSMIRTIKSKGAIVSNYGGNGREPWVSPADIAEVIAKEVELPFAGRMVRYIASDEVSPNEVAAALGQAIGKPDLQWQVIGDEQLLTSWLNMGFNEQIAKGFVEMQAGQGSGFLYEDYYRNKPELGRTKLADFANDFASTFKNE